MQGYITIKQASELTGKHPDTIRRLIKDNKDTKHVAKDRKGRLMISSEWLTSYFDPSEAPINADINTDSEEPVQSVKSPSDPTILALVAQLEAKDKQIADLLQANREKEANQTKLADQFQQIIAGLQLPATTTTVAEEPLQKPTYAEPMTTEAETPSKPQVKKPTKNLTKPNTKTKKKPSAKKPKAPVKTPSKPQTPKPAQSKKRWWSR